MTPDVATGPRTATVTTVESERKTSSRAVVLPSYEREYYDDVREEHHGEEIDGT